MKFSKWFQWKDREEFIDHECPGIYILARITVKPRDFANPLDKGIIYFGETIRPLSKRWGDFEKSAFYGKKVHSGGLSYLKRYGDKGKNLYVSAWSARRIRRIENSKIPWFIRYHERRLLWNFIDEYGTGVLLNKK